MTAPALWRLTPERLAEWREIGLAALRDAPGIFSGNWADWSARPDIDFLPALTESECWAAARVPGAPLAVTRWARDREQHDAGMLMSVFVRREARGMGMMDALITHILARATGQVGRMLLHVVQSNEPAIRLYHRHGFRPSPRPPFVNANGLTEIEMQRPLTLEARAPRG